MNRTDLSIPPTPSIRSAALRGSKPETQEVTAASPNTLADAGTSGVLVLGKGISFQGSIVGASRIVIEGNCESKRLETSDLVIGPTGVFRGEADVTHAEIDGRFEGLIKASGRLGILGNGNLVGSAQYGSLSVQDGGAISGELAATKG